MTCFDAMILLLTACWSPVTFAQVEGTQPAPQAASPLDSVRRAYLEGRDKEVLILAERSLIDAPPTGDLEMKAAELYFWKGSALRRLGRHDEALIALEHAKS